MRVLVRGVGRQWRVPDIDIMEPIRQVEQVEQKYIPEPAFERCQRPRHVVHDQPEPTLRDVMRCLDAAQRSIVGSWLRLLGWCGIWGWTIHLFLRWVLLFNPLLRHEALVMMVLGLHEHIPKILRMKATRGRRTRRLSIRVAMCRLMCLGLILCISIITMYFDTLYVWFLVVFVYLWFLFIVYLRLYPKSLSFIKRSVFIAIRFIKQSTFIVINIFW